MKKSIVVIISQLLYFTTFAQIAPDQKLQNYWQKTAPQKVNVDLDKPFYMAGDDVNYQVTLQYYGQKPAEEIVHFSLADAEGKIVWQMKTQAINGIAAGSFALPGNLPQENYLFYAHTRYLQNFGSRLFFKKIVPILSITDEDKTGHEFDLQFFTAGQHMIADVNNELIWVSNQPDSTNTLVLIYNNERALIKKISEKSFLFTPEANQRYFARIIYRGDTLSRTFNLPQVKKGAAIQWTGKESGSQLQINKTPGFNLRETTLLVAQWDEINYQEQISWQNRNEWSHTMPEVALSAGINYVALVNESGLVAHRLLYHPPGKKINRAKLKASYSFQEKVNTDLGFSKGLKGNLAISIHHLQEKENPVSVFVADLMAKDFNFIPEAGINPQQQLLAYQWKWWQWSEIEDQNFSEPEIEHEKGLAIAGQVTDATKGEMVSLSVPSGNPVFVYTQTNEEGEFYFSNLNFRGTRDFYLKAWGDELSDIQLDESEQDIKLPAYKLPALIPNVRMLKYKEQKILINKAKNTFAKYQQFDQSVGNTHPANLRDIVIDYDDYYVLDDYFSFPNMEDVMREIVLGVILRNRKSGYKIRILDRRTKYYFKKEPLILLDGIPATPEAIMSLNPTEVYGIAVTRPTGNFYDFGALGENGVLLVYTRQREYRPPVEAGLVHGEIKGYGDGNLYKTVKKPEKNIPDFRPLLHWQTAEISALQDRLPLDFYTSHDQAEYQIVISGFTDDGERIYETYNFSVN